MTDPDNLAGCRSCLHEPAAHTVDGCTVRDELGNRCACEQGAS